MHMMLVHYDGGVKAGEGHPRRQIGGYTAPTARAVLTASGDVHLPDEVREQLGPHPGDEVELRVLGVVGVAGGRRSASSLAGSVRSEARGVTLADMKRAIGEGATGQ
jgi:bifunctional DNA-binding transcriptional regulator/antitoxin component of YhaV-PrlF toxin-antitoxin module